MQRNSQVAVVGSANFDTVLLLPRFPDPGETMIGDGFHQVAGGKGLNQAIASASFAATSFIGLVGDDSAGRNITSRLTKAGVDVSFLLSRALPTGRAFVWVTPDGENSIAVFVGANSALTSQMVMTALQNSAPEIVLVQLEIPIDAARAAGQWANENGKRLVLNASPVPRTPLAFLASADPLIANVGEARAILNGATDSPLELAEMLGRHARSVVVTNGAKAGVVFDGVSTTTLATVPVTAVDTTGAGDVFAGTLAGRLAAGDSLIQAAIRANEEAAHIVTLARSAR
jgi:ribokinase